MTNKLNQIVTIEKRQNLDSLSTEKIIAPIKKVFLRLKYSKFRLRYFVGDKIVFLWLGISTFIIAILKSAR
jgi:hypothetical protein